MTDYFGFSIPLPLLYEQTLTGSLDTDIEGFTGYEGDPAFDLRPIIGTLTRGSSLVHQVASYAGYRVPSYADVLFGHIVIEPERLDLGNLLSLQTRTIVIGNLNLESVNWTDFENLAGDGITFNNLPSLPHEILPFGSFELSVSISPTGPPTIDGAFVFTFDLPEVVTVPVTGSRIVMFHWIAQTPASERLGFFTDIIEAYDATEQRIRARIAARQEIRYTVAVEGVEGMELRATLFDWMPRVWGVPIWWEKRDLQNTALIGATTLEVSTLYGDFRVGDLVMLYIPATEDTPAIWEALQIDSFTSSQIETTAGVSRQYEPGTFVVPVRACWMQTNTEHNRQPDGTQDGFEKTSVLFTTIDNVDLSDQAGATFYNGRVVLDDGNIVTDTLPESIERPVIVIDNKSGRILQTFRTDRSRIKSVKTWDAPTPAELWRVRQLVHSFHGSQKSFWVPTCRIDLQLSDPIGPGTTEFRVLRCGYTSFVQGRRPLGDVRIVLATGEALHRRVDSSVVDADEEVITVTEVIYPTALEVEDVVRIELMMLMRIADDSVQIEHRKVGDATITMNLISIKE